MENQDSSNSAGNEEHYSADSTQDFFSAMEGQVNGAVVDENVTQEATPQNRVVNTAPANVATEGSQRVNWKKRYEDSSREAKRIHGEMQGLKPYAAIIQAMKNDGGLVDHVKDYLTSGGTNKSIQSKLGLGEDFEFDANELGDANSDSSKVMNAHVDTLVKQRMQQFGQASQEKANKDRFMKARLDEEKQFRATHPEMDDTTYSDMLKKASTHRLSLEDIHYILNKDSSNNKVAMNVKKDMVEQMKNARNIPASASGLNNAQQSVSQDDNVFDALKGVDQEINDLFG